MDVSILTHVRKAVHGEGAMWDCETQKLHWVDITGHTFHRQCLRTHQHDMLDTGTYVGFGVLDTQGRAVLGLQDGIYRMAFGGREKTLLARPIPPDPRNRFNDGKVAPDGTLFAGTVNLFPGADKPPTGCLYSLNALGWSVVATDIHISNGLGWSPDSKIMYYTDTLRHEISQFDYDVAKGQPRNRRPFVVIPCAEGLPDGLCVDAEGRVLTAMWGGSRVNIYDPSGKLDQVIVVDALCPSSVAFGGPDLKTLFITTASAEHTPEELKTTPLSGHMFAASMPIGGLPSTRFAY